MRPPSAVSFASLGARHPSGLGEAGEGRVNRGHGAGYGGKDDSPGSKMDPQACQHVYQVSTRAFEHSWFEKRDGLCRPLLHLQFRDQRLLQQLHICKVKELWLWRRGGRVGNGLAQGVRRGVGCACICACVHARGMPTCLTALEAFASTSRAAAAPAGAPTIRASPIAATATSIAAYIMHGHGFSSLSACAMRQQSPHNEPC